MKFDLSDEAVLAVCEKAPRQVVVQRHAEDLARFTRADRVGARGGDGVRLHAFAEVVVKPQQLEGPPEVASSDVLEHVGRKRHTVQLRVPLGGQPVQPEPVGLGPAAARAQLRELVRGVHVVS